MKTLFAVLATVATIGIATPVMAQGIDVRIGAGAGPRHHHYDGYRHRPARVVVVQKPRHWDRGYHRSYRSANRPAVVIAR